MKGGKILIQGLGLVALGAALWFAFYQIDFMSVFNIAQNKGKTEEKLGDLIWESLEETERVVTNDSVVKPLEKLFRHLCKENDIDPESIELHVVDRSEVNAFALPGGHLVVFTGLIQDCDSESELAGVIGHEIAHIEKDHVMKKLVKELGLAVIVSGSGQGGAIAREALHTLTSSAYDRSLETEADMTSVEYLENAQLDPSKFADFMYKMSRNSDMPDAVYWISTHPESEERALAIIDKIKGRTFKIKKVLSEKEWNGLINY